MKIRFNAMSFTMGCAMFFLTAIVCAVVLICLLAQS
jgi:hypothetical protein